MRAEGRVFGEVDRSPGVVKLSLRFGGSLAECFDLLLLLLELPLLLFHLGLEFDHLLAERFGFRPLCLPTPQQKGRDYTKR